MEKAGNKEKELSRREVVLGGGILAAGAVAISALSGSDIGLLSRAEARETPLPWPYEKIDPQEAAKIAYEGFYEALCCYGVARGIMVPLQKKIGEPYISQPLYEGLKLGSAGIAGWGTVCGALLASTVVTGFILPPAGVGEQILNPTGAGNQILNELFQWYSNSPLPVFEPDKPRTEIRTQSVSNSPLCHISVGKWLKNAGKTLNSPEQKERCARLSGDVAMRTAMLLNEWKDGRFNPALKPPINLYGIPMQHNCNECHTDKAPNAFK
jgi:hypothetical protein